MSARRGILLAPATVGVAAVAVLVVLAVPGVQFVVRGLLAGVFLVAGVAKLRDRASFSQVLATFWVRGSAVPAGAGLLPVAEVAVAIALLLPATSAVGAVGALALLVLFSSAVAVALARGRSADCGCFGKDRSSALSAATLLRNGVLVGLAGGVAVAHSGQDTLFGATTAVTSLAAIGVAALVAVGLLAARRPRRELTAQPNVGVAVAATGESSESALSRRGWLRVAGGAGLAGAMGSWLGVLGASPADAVPVIAVCKPATEKFDPNADYCGCVKQDVFGHCCQWACYYGSGFAGGGLVQTASGRAQAAFSGNTLKLRGGPQLTKLRGIPPQLATGGGLVWFDATWQGSGLLLQLTRVKNYRRVPGTNIRELTGFASANGSGKHPFVLRVVDAGKPGSGLDTVILTVSGVAGSGAGGTGSTYTADGHLVQGGLTVKLLHTTKGV